MSVGHVYVLWRSGYSGPLLILFIYLFFYNMEVFILVMSVLGLIKLEIRIEGPNPFQEPMELYLLKESGCECVRMHMYV